MSKTSPHPGVYKATETNKYGKKYEYWYANVYVDGIRHKRRCVSEAHAIEEVDRMCKKFNKEIMMYL